MTAADVAMAEGSNGIVYAVGSGLGRGSLGNWRWTPWPQGLEPTGVDAAPDGPRVVVWGKGRLALSLDGGETMSMPVSESISVAWAALEPGSSDALWLADSSGVLYRLPLN